MGKLCNVAAPISTVNGITINKSKPCNTGNYNDMASREVKYIVMHYTGNYKDTAANNANYFMNNVVEVSAHYFVDDTSIWQSVDVNDKAWHCGDDVYYHPEARNTNSIGIEMCCTAGNYKIGAKALENSAQLVAALCKYLDITDIDKYIVRHYDVTHKNCPAQMAGDNNSEWVAFKKRVKEIMNPLVVKTLKFEVGDVVNFTGNKHYANAYAATGYSCKSGKARVTNTAPGTNHPYHLINVSGSSSTVYGWVDEKFVTEIKAASAPEFEIGDLVNFTGNKHYTTAASLTGYTCQPGEAKITATSYGSKHPYHLVRINGGKSTVYGWVNAADVAALDTTVVNKKSVETIAKEVLRGLWGNGAEREKRLEAAGYNYDEVQDKVNELLYG